MSVTQAGLTEEELRQEIYRLAPFHHSVELPYGLNTHIPELSHRAVESTRLGNLVRHAFPALLDVCGGSLKGMRVLDVGCNCGGFSVEASKLGARYVLGFDSVGHYIDQANLIKRAWNLRHVDFKVLDLDQVEVSTVGQFDVTLCLGILYHLQNPVWSMKRLAEVTRHVMLVDTDLAYLSWKERPFCHFFVRRPFWLMNMEEAFSSDPVSETTNRWRTDKVIEFRPNEAAVIELLEFLGFQKVVKLKPARKDLEKRYYVGERAAFLAVRT